MTAWTDVAAAGDIAEGGMLSATGGGHQIALFRLDGAIFALLDQCSHGYARLTDGYIEDGCVECPLHQGLLDIRTGEPCSPPITEPVRSFPTRVMGDRIEVDVAAPEPMAAEEARAVVLALYATTLQRNPAPDELEMWVGVLRDGQKLSDVIESFGKSDEYQARHGVVPFFAPGHYYSPVVKPDDAVRQYMAAQAGRVGPAPYGIPIDAASMQRFFQQNAAFMAAARFTDAKTPQHRFYADNGGFPLGDALTLRAMIHHARPRRIVEIGSGFSTACMLDTLDEVGLAAQVICIDPHADRLRSLLRPTDRVKIIESPVQAVPARQFAALDRNDILFIDSTHVVKTGSDVHYELFEILPVLKPGVFVHFHDVVYPFEYPLEWVFEHNHSWNEAYFLRAFLMYNTQFAVFYSSSYMLQHAGDLLRRHIPDFPANPGSGLWLVKTGDP